MNTLVNKLVSGGFYFGSGVTNTKEFDEFFEDFKKSFTYQLNNLGASDISFSKGHFYLSGFFKVDTQWYYFSLSDVRSGLDSMLIRTAKNAEDYTGGANNFFIIKNGMYKEIARRFRIEIPKNTTSKVKDKSYYVEKAIQNGFLEVYTGSMKKAQNIAWALDSALKDDDQRGVSITERKIGNSIVSSSCQTDKFSFYYSGDTKRLSIEVFSDTFNAEEFMKTLDIPNGSRRRVNPFTGGSEQLEPEAVALHDFIKNAEATGKPNFRNALLLFRERYPKEYMTLLD
jgi:hypothetical protein